MADDAERPTQERIARWLEYLQGRGETRLTNDALALMLHLAEPTVTNILNRKSSNRYPGLTVFVKLIRYGNLRADEILKQDPPDTINPAPPGLPPPGDFPTNSTAPPDPSIASASGQPAGRKKRGAG